MLSALGKLNADLLTMYYGDEPVSAERVSKTLREANMLWRRAHANLTTAINQDRHDAEEGEMSNMAAMSRHVARHTIEPNSLCTGPCITVPRQSIHPIQQAAQGLYGPNRTHAVKQLTSELAELTSSPTGLRLCSTGIPCVAARFDRSNDVVNLRETKKPNREKVATQIFKEAVHVRKLANMVATSRVRELEAGDSHFSRIELSGGGTPRVSNHDSVKQFFRQHQLGEAPDTGDIRVALNHLTDTIAPHSRQRVKIDLWSRWIKI
jgi:hypothetical protein